MLCVNGKLMVGQQRTDGRIDVQQWTEWQTFQHRMDERTDKCMDGQHWWMPDVFLSRGKVVNIWQL